MSTISTSSLVSRTAESAKLRPLSSEGDTDETKTCCFGQIVLRKGIFILSFLTIIFSVLFISFDVFFRDVTSWWVWGGTITGIGGGLLGCSGVLMERFYKLILAYLVWALLLCTWWFVFIVLLAIDFGEDPNWGNFWDMLWSIALLIWTIYTCHIIYKYYKSIKPSGPRSKRKKQTGYSAIE